MSSESESSWWLMASKCNSAPIKGLPRDAFPVVDPDLVVTLTLGHWKLLTVMKDLFLLGFSPGIFCTLQM